MATGSYQIIDDGIGLDMLDDDYTDLPYGAASTFDDNLAIADMRARARQAIKTVEPVNN